MTIGMERLQFMVGEWDIRAHTMTKNGQWVASPQPTNTVIEPVFGGIFLEEKEVLMMMNGVTVRFFIMWSYDKYRETYRMIASDDQDGLTDVLEGGYDDNTKSNTIVVSNLNTGTSVQDAQGNHTYLRLSSTKNTEDSFTDEMHESYDAGKNWLAVYRAVHTRKS